MSTPISVQGYKKLEKELEALKKERPAVIQAIKDAREEGDLRENAGYDAARERQGFLEARINYIESQLPQYTVIDLDTLSGDRVTFGATVHVVDVDTDDISRSISLLMSGDIEYEFRTTVVRELHTPQDIGEIGEWIRGAKRFFLQSFTDSGDIISIGLSAYTPEEMAQILNFARKSVPSAELRGI